MLSHCNITIYVPVLTFQQLPYSSTPLPNFSNVVCRDGLYFLTSYSLFSSQKYYFYHSHSTEMGCPHQRHQQPRSSIQFIDFSSLFTHFIFLFLETQLPWLLWYFSLLVFFLLLWLLLDLPSRFLFNPWMMVFGDFTQGFLSSPSTYSPWASPLIHLPCDNDSQTCSPSLSLSLLEFRPIW